MPYDKRWTLMVLKYINLAVLQLYFSKFLCLYSCRLGLASKVISTKFRRQKRSSSHSYVQKVNIKSDIVRVLTPSHGSFPHLHCIMGQQLSLQFLPFLLVLLLQLTISWDRFVFSSTVKYAMSTVGYPHHQTCRPWDAVREQCRYKFGNTSQLFILTLDLHRFPFDYFLSYCYVHLPFLTSSPTTLSLGPDSEAHTQFLHLVKKNQSQQ